MTPNLVPDLEALPDSYQLTLPQIATLTQLTTKGLRSLIAKGRGPRISRIGSRAMRVSVADARAYLAAAAEAAR